MKKNVLITGGTRGIGAGIAKVLLRNGYNVVVTYQNNNVHAKCFEKETGIMTFCWDVSNYQQCIDGVKKVCEMLDGNVNILINNAGIIHDKMFHKMVQDDWQKVISTNLTSVFNMCSVVIDSMRKDNYGRIINISSVNGLKGQVGQCNYAATKAGIIGFTKSLALESASKGITVNAIAPGYISTDMTNAIDQDIINDIISTIPVGRFGKIEEIAEVVLFLLSNGASFVTGATINVNGGQYMC